MEKKIKNALNDAGKAVAMCCARHKKAGIQLDAGFL